MKKNRTRSIAALLTAVMLLTALSALAFALPSDQSNSEGSMLPGEQTDVDQAFLAELTYDADVGGASVSLQEVDGEYYLFLPSSADLSELVLRFAGHPVTLMAGEQSIIVTAGQAFDLTALCPSAPADGVYNILLSRGDESLSVNLMVSANIASMFITSADPVNKGRDYVEEVKGNKATGQMTMLDAGGEPVYIGDLTQIKGRGNSTWACPKKPYQIKLSDKTDLLETGDPGERAKTWVLLANYYDDAFIRNSLTYDLAAELGLPYSPGSRPVDLYYDGEYRGTYLLCEKTEVGSARVDIHDLEEDYEYANSDVEDFDGLPTAEGSNAYGNKYHYVTGLTDPVDISGGYLLEMDFAERAALEKSWFTTSHDFNIVSKSPEYLSSEAMEYISGFYQEFEDAVWNGGINPDTGKSYTDYVDLDSLARCYVIAEFAENGDAFCSSSFFYKPAGEEKLYAGPVWDFDLCYKVKYFGITSITYLVANMTSFGQKLLAIPSFFEAVEDIYRNELYPLANNVLLSTDADARTGRFRSLAGYQAEVAVSQQLNSVLWPKIAPQGHAASVNMLRDFIIQRGEFLSSLDWASLSDLLSALTFSDISVNDWYVSNVAYAVDKGLLAGTGDGLFSPEAILTRAMAVTVLHRLAGSPDVPNTTDAADAPDTADTTDAVGTTSTADTTDTADASVFVDVLPDQWYTEAVAWAAGAGLLEAYPDKLFCPDEEITRQEMALLFYLYYTRCLDGAGAAPALPDSFLDRDDIADWAVDAMAWSVDRGILNGVSGTELSPSGHTQRCMAAAILQRFCELIEAEQTAQ